MASWTDTTPKFNPYVEQLPVKAMVEVGMEKQKRYEEGVKKIQAQIDSVAGMDLMKDVHKQYLESKLNSLGNNLKIVAAGDFSNYQLVNSVMGMTNQITKDPTLQNALISTQKARTELANIQKAQKAGKSSVQNEEFFNTDLGDWLNDGDLKSSFTGEFIEYTDVGKKLRDIVDKMAETENITEIPYMRDKAGNIRVDANGDPVIDMAMLRIKTKGKPAEKILATFYDSLDANDQRQLGIDSWYHYRGATKDTFRKDIISSYEDKKQMFSDEVKNLNLELQNNKDLTSAERSSIQARINTISESLNNKSLDIERDNELMKLNSTDDIESYKYKLYTQNWLTNLARDLSNQSIQQTYETNPYEQADMARKRLQFDYDNANRQQLNWQMQFDWDQKKFAIEHGGTGIPGMGDRVAEPGALPTGADRPTLVGLEKDVASTQTAIDEINARYAPLVVPSSIGAGITDPNKRVEAQKAYLDDMVKSYMTDPSTINSITDPNMREFLEQRRAYEIKKAQKYNLYTSVVEESKKFDDELATSLGREEGLKFRNTIVTASDLFDFTKDFEKFYVPGELGMGGVYGGGTSKFDAEGLLNKYKGTKLEPVAVAYVKQRTGAPMTPTERFIFDRTSAIGKKYDVAAMDVNKRKMDFQSDYLAKRMPEIQSTRFTISNANKFDMDRVRQLVGNSLSTYRELGSIDVRNESDFVPDTISKLLKEENATYSITKKGDGSAEIVINGEAGTQIVPMTAFQFANYFPQYAKSNPINEIKTAVNSSKNHTTNIAGGAGDNPSNAVNALLSGYDMPLLKNSSIAHLVRFDVEGNPFNQGDANDRFVLRMYVNDNGVWKTAVVTREGYKNAEELQQIMSQIGEGTVKDFLEKNK